MSVAGSVNQTLTLTVPKATGTPGDTLVAWGLAIFVREGLSDQQTVLSDHGEYFLIETGVRHERLESLLADFSWKRLSGSRLRWLASEQKGRMPKNELAIDWLDRDSLRNAYQLWRENMRTMKPQANGGEPSITAAADTRLYPFYEVLTNPGTQWAGYNSFVERLYCTLTPDGVRTLLALYDEQIAQDIASNTTPGTRRAKLATFNPPGFLYPGMNKGPTMRVTDAHGVTVGSASTADWTLIDRGDRSLFENYLAYIGYFQVARIVTTKEQRVVAVPMPGRVSIRVILSNLPGRELESTNLTDYLAAQSALDYGRAALDYLTSLQGAGATTLERRGTALRGAHLSVFWRPNGNVFAPKRLTQIAMPVWLPALRAQSLDIAKKTLGEHQKRLRAVRGPRRDENKLSAEQRHAIENYLLSLNGDRVAWFDAVALWFPAARAAARANWNVGLWSTEEVRRIALAMSNQQEQASLKQLLDAPEFKRLASTIRLSTVVPHITRERRKKDPSIEAHWDIRYELVTQLRTAAERGPDDFLREFYAFIAQYNDETARPKTGRGRPLARTDDLQWLSERMTDPKLKKDLPAALLAFGTSLRGKPTGDATTASNAGDNDADTNTDSDDFTDPDVDSGE